MDILSAEGMHGLRYFQGQLQIKVNGVWKNRPVDEKVYGVSIDTTNSNPATSVTYTDDAVGITGGSALWDNTPIFSKVKPCLLKNGVVQYYLNPDDFTKKQDGGAADITSGKDGDVMIEIPRLAYMMYRDGSNQIIKVTNSPNPKAIDSRFCTYAHTRAAEGDRAKLYYGAYLGWYDGTALRSLSGHTPSASQTNGTYRSWAQANGAGYDIISFYPMTLLQCLFTIRYKSTNSQTALGMGYTQGNTQPANTGTTNGLGMYFGEAAGKQQVKFAGIEDFWGNLNQMVDGVFLDENWNLLTGFAGFNDVAAGYTSHGQIATANQSGYTTKIIGSNEAGFVQTAKTAIGTNQYWCDQSALTAGCMAVMGGHYAYGLASGAYQIGLNRTSMDTHSLTGVRLMML